MAAKQNSYSNLGLGVVIGDNKAMADYTKSKVRLVDDIQRLSYSILSQASGGIRGKAFLDGFRHAMILFVDQCDRPLHSWREVANAVAEMDSSDFGAIDFRR